MLGLYLRESDAERSQESQGVQRLRSRYEGIIGSRDREICGRIAHAEQLAGQLTDLSKRVDLVEATRNALADSVVSWRLAAIAAGVVACCALAALALA